MLIEQLSPYIRVAMDSKINFPCHLKERRNECQRHVHPAVHSFAKGELLDSEPPPAYEHG